MNSFLPIHSAAPKAVLLCAGAALLSACAAPSEPCSYNFRDQQFVSIAVAAATNEYQRCSDHLRSQLLDLQVQVEQTKRDADRLEKLAASSSADLRKSQLRLASVNRKTANMVQQLDVLRAQRKKDRSNLNTLVGQQKQIQNDVKQLNRKAISTSDPNLAAEIRAMELKQAALQRALEVERNS